MGRPPKYHPSHPRFRVNLAGIPRRTSILLARAAKMAGLPVRTWAIGILTREAVYTLIAAQNHPLVVVPGGRLWSVGIDGSWAVAGVSDGSERFLICNQLAGCPAIVSEDGVAVSGHWYGHGVNYVVAYDDLAWQGVPPTHLNVKKFFEALMRMEHHEESPAPPGPGPGGLPDPVPVALEQPGPLLEPVTLPGDPGRPVGPGSPGV